MASARSGNALGPIQRLFDEGTLTGMTDAQLLDRFLIGRDESAFSFLVARHGPMVLAVCRGVLRDRNDAEDAFQATFLVLFRKAGGLRAAGSLGSWLYRVAYRIALRANAVAARRRERSSEEDVMAAEAASTSEAGVDRELLPIIHAEIDRLPDRYRAPIALCYLEGLSYEQAAHHLGWPIGTVGSRIARARELLRSRLARRGVTATTAVRSALLAREATAAPAALIEATTRAAMGLGGAASGAKAAGTVSAAVALSDGFLRRMLMIRLIQMTSVLAVAATAGFMAWGSLADGVGPKSLPAGPQAGPVAAAKDDVAGVGPIRGRVLDPGGKPVRDAAIYVGETRSAWLIEPVARTGADGRFTIDLDKVAEKHRSEPFRMDWKRVELTALAPGYGGGWAPTAGSGGGEIQLRLCPDDVPIRGRVLDTQGRPLAGVSVRVQGISDPPTVDLDTLLSSGGIQEGRPTGGGCYDIDWWVKNGSDWTRRTLKTDANGRFRIDGAGRDRIVAFEIEGPGIGRATGKAMTRVAPASARPRPGPIDPMTHPRFSPLHGASFDYVVSPSKPIEGVVRLKGNGRPLTGVPVHGTATETGVQASAVTDANGRFRLDGLPKLASYRVSAVPYPGQPYLQATMTISDSDGLKPIPVTLELPKGVVVRGRLIDKGTGKPVAGQIVQHLSLPSNANEGHGTPSRPFGPEGFAMTVPPGPALFNAQAEGKNLPYTRAQIPEAARRLGVGGENDNTPIRTIISPYHVSRMVDVPADVDTFTVDLELSRGNSRKGRLVDPKGKPVVGALAYGLSAGWTVKTLDDDNFEVDGLEPGKSRTVSFMHKDRRLAGAVKLEPGHGPVRVQLAPCGSATGRLVDQEGQPMAGARIMLGLLDHAGHRIPGNIGLWPQEEVFVADKDGRFRIEGINPALSVAVGARSGSQPDVFLEPEESRKAILQHLTARPAETVDLGEIRMIRQPNG